LSQPFLVIMRVVAVVAATARMITRGMGAAGEFVCLSDNRAATAGVLGGDEPESAEGNEFIMSLLGARGYRLRMRVAGVRFAMVTSVAVVTSVVAGCSSGPEIHASTSAAPARPLPSVAASPVVAPVRPTGAAATSPSAGPLVLGDEGVGGLGLGMSWKQAIATGLVKADIKNSDLSSPDCRRYDGKRGVDSVYFTKGKVTIIAVGSSIGLAGGVGVGDTYAQLHRAYPGRDLDSAPGRVYFPATGAKISASYRIGLDSDAPFPDSKITEIAIQSADQSCYE
jgi:hypothetical protein